MDWRLVGARSARVVGVLLAMAIAAGGSVARAAEPPRTLRLISTDGADTPVNFTGVSADGARAYFTTTEAIPGTGDNDTARDTYERSASGALRLISTSGANAADAFWRGNTADGSRVFFETTEAIVGTGDTDTAQDVYERSANGALRLISTGGANTNAEAVFVNTSADGGRAFFVTREAIPGMGDSGLATIDVYERSANGDLRLISTGSATADSHFRGASTDGTRVLFDTTAAIPGSGDNDTATDVYERSASGALRLISTNGANTSAAFWRGNSADGSRVFFETDEALPGTGDNDTALDLYERSASGALRLISTNGANTSAASWKGASLDGGRVFFDTDEALPGTGDNDTGPDVYERSATGALRLISTGGANTQAVFAGASGDGSRAFFFTAESIPGTGDSDTANDIYERSANGALRLISTNGENKEAVFIATSADGSRVFFITAEAIPGTGDSGGAVDTYERFANGALRLISMGSPSAEGWVSRISTTGSRAFFPTTQAIPGTGDEDAAIDVYERAWGAPTFVTPPAVTGSAVAGSVVTCATNGAAAEVPTVTVQWLRDGAAIAGAVGPTLALTNADPGHLISCRATVRNVIGSASQTSAPVRVLVPDRSAPKVGLTTPTCPKRLAGSKRRCAAFKRSAAAYRTLRGTISDPSGVKSVEVGAIRKTGRRCAAYDGKRFRRMSCSKARTKFVKAKITGGKWSLTLKGIRRGSYAIQVRATDKAGNRSRTAKTNLRLS